MLCKTLKEEEPSKDVIRCDSVFYLLVISFFFFFFWTCEHTHADFFISVTQFKFK